MKVYLPILLQNCLTSFERSKKGQTEHLYTIKYLRFKGKNVEIDPVNPEIIDLRGIIK